MISTEVFGSVQDFAIHLSEDLGSSDKTIKAYCADVRSFSRFLASTEQEPQCTLRDTKRDIPTQFVAWLRNKPKNGPATIRRKLVSLGAYFRWRVASGKSTTSPFEEVRIPIRMPKRLPRALPRCDVTMLLTAGKRAYQNQKMRETYIALQLLIATGLRIGEMCSINAVDVVRDGSAIRITGKGNRERAVFVGNKRLRREVAALTTLRIKASGPHTPFFQNSTSSRLSPQTFRMRLHKLTKESGIVARVTPHRLRHTAATLLIEEGVDIRLVQRLLGHASIATTEIYTHVADTSLAAALDRADPLRHVQR